MFPTHLIHHAAELIDQADSLVIAAGAGMGVDSGLPDFRGSEGFWKAYPALGQQAIPFYEIANPAAFRRHPQLAWGFYGHRLRLYRNTLPHAGFDILRRWGDAKTHGLNVYTSNVDGHFQQAGMQDTHIHECHGSIHYLQCLLPCRDSIWQADPFIPEVDEMQCQLLNAAPTCPHCGGMARPNILMFGDADWLEQRAQQQAARQANWLSRVSRPLVIELGAGTAIPSVRNFSHRVMLEYGGRLLRINLRESQVPFAQDVGLAMGALEALTAIQAVLDH
ncbi:MAG: Sir2 family NAD-dependent protein deacetylase [Undibacterium umbellatum]|uniref:SIR2 family NAD-dependent protein deacylase n=1 Tax=Undibacterium umbellatum TaxID=2762300 RepID=UPI003BB4F758